MSELFSAIGKLITTLLESIFGDDEELEEEKQEDED